MNIKLLIAAAMSGALVIAGCATDRVQKVKGEQGEVVDAEGVAPYQSDDLPASKAGALAAAQRSAVELVVGVYVSAKTRVDKAVVVEQNILTHTSGYVKRYEILSEGPDGPWYKMKIRALVSTQALHEDLDRLGLLRQVSVGNPRVAISLQEYVGESPSDVGSAARALTQGLLNNGFKVVDLPSTIKPDEDPNDAAKALTHAQAELLIAGMGRAQLIGKGKDFGGMSSYRAAVTFRVLETGSGEVLQTVSETASGLEATPEIAAEQALEKAGQLAANDLISLPDELSKRAHVDLTLSGITSFEVLNKFEKSLAAQSGVTDLFLRSFSQDSQTAVLDVLIDQIGPQELADLCVKIGGPTWSVFQVSGRSVQISASQAGR